MVHQRSNSPCSSHETQESCISPQFRNLWSYLLSCLHWINPDKHHWRAWIHTHTYSVQIHAGMVTINHQGTIKPVVPGKKNLVDALSWDMDRSAEELTQILLKRIPQQVPKSLKNVHLTNKIVSWVTLLLLKLFREEHTKSMLEHGNIGTSSAMMQDSKGTTSSQICCS